MSVNRERKRRKESGLRRIFERSLKELKTKVHVDEEEQPTSSVHSDNTLQMESIPNTLQKSSGKKEEDTNAAKQREGQENAPVMLKQKEAYSAANNEQKINENLKKSEEIQGDSAVSYNLNNCNSNLKVGEHILTYCKKKGDFNSQVMEDEKNKIDYQSVKALSRNKDKQESEIHRGSKNKDNQESEIQRGSKNKDNQESEIQRGSKNKDNQESEIHVHRGSKNKDNQESEIHVHRGSKNKDNQESEIHVHRGSKNKDNQESEIHVHRGSKNKDNQESEIHVHRGSKNKDNQESEIHVHRGSKNKDNQESEIHVHRGSKNKDEQESEMQRGSKNKDNHESEIQRGMKLRHSPRRKETKSDRREIYPFYKARESENKGPTSKHAERRRHRVEDKFLGRSKGKEKESACKSVEKKETPRSLNAEWNKNQRSERKGFGTPRICGEDWMSELIDVPNVQPTKIIIPNTEVVKENTKLKECSPTLGLIHQCSKDEECSPATRQIHHSGDEHDHTKCMSVSMNDTYDNICDRYEKNISDSKSQTNANIRKNDDMDKSVIMPSKTTDIHEEELWECQEVPSATENILKEDKFCDDDLRKTESMLETIKEENESSYKETGIKHIMDKRFNVQDTEKSVSENEAVKDDKQRNSDDIVVIRKEDQEKVSSQDCNEDWMATEGDPHTKKCLEDVDNVEAADILGNSEETLSFEGEDNSCAQDHKDPDDSPATGNSSSLFSESNVSSVEEWSRDIQDQEDFSNTYHILLHDKIAALKNRIPTSSQSLHRRQVGGFRCRGKHRQSPSPFQTYLKTILPGDETSTCIEQENSVKFKEEDLKDSCTGVIDKKQVDLSRKDFIEQKTEESYSSSVCTKRDLKSKCKWPTARQPPGFLTRTPSLPMMESGPVSSSVASFDGKMVDSRKTLELCEKLNEYASMSVRDQESEEKMKISGLSASFYGDEVHATSADVKKDVSEIDDLVSGGENWEDSTLDAENMESLSLKNQLATEAMVPNDTVIVSKFPEESGPEQWVPEDQEAFTSGTESLGIQHPSNSLCNSQNTLSGIPTISEYETSVKDGDLDSQYEDSIEDGFHKNSSQGVTAQSESDDSLSMYNRSTKQNLEESLQNTDVKMEGSKDLSPRNRKTVHKGVANYRNGLNCECPAECVQFWMWRNCLCQAPYLCSIETETNEHPSRNCELNRAYVYPVDQNNNPPASVGNLKVNIDESVLKKWRLAGFWSDAPVHHSADEKGKRPRSTAAESRKQEGGKHSSRKVTDRQKTPNIGNKKCTQYSRARQLGTASSVAMSDRKLEASTDIVQDDSSNDVGSEVLVMADGDSGDEYVVEKVDRPISEDVDDLSESDVREDQENPLHSHYLASFPPGQSQNYLAYPPSYGYCSPYPPGYPGSPVAVRPGYPTSYPELYYPFPHPYINGGFSRQPYMDGQMCPDHPGYPPPMSHPYHMMFNGWREMSLHYEELYRGSTTRCRYPSSCVTNEGQERSRRESESYESYHGDGGHSDVAEDESHHHFVLDGPHLTRKKTEDKIGRSCDKSTAAEESSKKNVYIPPHKRIPCMSGYYIDRESRPTTNGAPSSPSYLYTNSEPSSRSWRDDRNRLDCSSNHGRSEMEHGRSQENILIWPMPWEYYSSVQNMRGNHSSFYHGWHQQGGLGPTSHTETTGNIKASEEEELPGCDISLPPSSTDSTPTSRPPRFSRLKQEKDTNLVTLDWKSAFLERCDSYGVGYLDSHCHIDFLFNRLDFKGKWSDFQAQNMDTFPPSYLGCVAVFCNPNSFKQDGLWKSLSKECNVWLTFGCHPKNARDFSRWNEEGLRRCLRNDRVVALGEIGLDYSGGFVETKEMQKSVFKRQIRIALNMKKPLVIHCRDAEKDCLDILKQMLPRDYKLHCHCFTGDFTSAKLWLDHFPNLYIGLTPLVTYRTATGARDVAKFISLGRLLLESDAPYFVPKTIPKEAMHYSHPGLCVTVAEEVARLKNISVQAVLEACLENTKDMYGI